MDRCNCMVDLGALLATKNGRIGFIMSLDRGINGRPCINVEKINPRGKKPPVMIASFCPFCGTKYCGTTP